MRNRYLILFFILILLTLAIAACGTSATAAPATIEPTQEQPPLAPTSGPAAVSTESSAPQTSDTTSSQSQSVSFVNDVMPIFESRCTKCHGGESTKEGLDLNSYASLMAGSKNGSVVTPGNANDSYLVDQLLNGKMPKRGPKLTPDQIQAIVNWVNAGALDN